MFLKVVFMTQGRRVRLSADFGRCKQGGSFNARPPRVCSSDGDLPALLVVSRPRLHGCWCSTMPQRTTLRPGRWSKLHSEDSGVSNVAVLYAILGTSSWSSRMNMFREHL